MKCEKGIEKAGLLECSGPFCKPDLFNATRIAQNFTEPEIDERIAKVEEGLTQKPESCDLQGAYNQLTQTAQYKKNAPRSENN